MNAKSADTPIAKLDLLDVVDELFGDDRRIDRDDPDAMRRAIVGLFLGDEVATKSTAFIESFCTHLPLGVAIRKADEIEEAQAEQAAAKRAGRRSQ